MYACIFHTGSLYPLESLPVYILLPAITEALPLVMKDGKVSASIH